MQDSNVILGEAQDPGCLGDLGLGYPGEHRPGTDVVGPEWRNGAGREPLGKPLGKLGHRILPPTDLMSKCVSIAPITPQSGEVSIAVSVSLFGQSRGNCHGLAGIGEENSQSMEVSSLSA
jgi:hypothetical protein